MQKVLYCHLVARTSHCLEGWRGQKAFNVCSFYCGAGTVLGTGSTTVNKIRSLCFSGTNILFQMRVTESKQINKSGVKSIGQKNKAGKRGGIEGRMVYKRQSNKPLAAWRKLFQEDGKASAKFMRWDYSWYTQGTERGPGKETEKYQDQVIWGFTSHWGDFGFYLGWKGKYWKVLSREVMWPGFFQRVILAVGLRADTRGQRWSQGQQLGDNCLIWVADEGGLGECGNSGSGENQVLDPFKR